MRELVRRVAAAVSGMDAEILFVDDSIDDTPDVVRAVAAEAQLPVRLIHRDVHTGGLGGAVVEGIRAAESDLCLVMDGDLQHPPEKIPELVDRYRQGDVDVVIASRYAGGGTAHGLADRSRVLVSKASTSITKAMFPVRLRDVTDPMTGFFLVSRTAVDLDSLRPRGFKILLEILVRKGFRIAEVPFHFADRHAGESKASLRQGVHFLTQLGVDYIVAAVIAAEATIIGNFLLIEHFVFNDMRNQASGVWARFAKSFAFNNAEAVIRIPIVAFMVETGHISAVVATAVTLVVAFVVRFVFHSLVVYAPRKTGPATPLRGALERIDEQAMEPGEL